MWKKDDETPAEKETPDRARRGEADRPGAGAATPATIGPSITITGDVKGEEDLVIQGRVDGSVELENQAVTVGREGRVKAAIVGRVVTVEGEVRGDLTADEQVILRSAAQVEGDITAPRVILEDGANFRGLVDMTNPGKELGSPRSRSGTERASSRSSAASGRTGSKADGGSSGAGSADDDAGEDSAASKGSGSSGTTEKAGT